MLGKVITLRFDSLSESFSDEALTEFIKDKNVLGIREHFFQQNGTTYLAIFITYEPTAMAKPAAPAKKEEDWRALIGEKERPLFNTLREWRKERCHKEGIPPYVICTNKALATLVLKRPKTLAALGGIEGFGKAKVEKYGEDLIKLLAEGPSE